jgi:hypothetical protein
VPHGEDVLVLILLTLLDDGELRHLRRRLCVTIILHFSRQFPWWPGGEERGNRPGGSRTRWDLGRARRLMLSVKA